MAFTIIQAGDELQLLNTEGEISNLSLFTGANLSTSTVPRWVVYNGLVVLVNTPSTSLTIDPKGVVRPLTPKAPNLAPTTLAGDAGALTGTYYVRFTYIIRDINGRLIAESDFSPVSNTSTIAAKQLKVTGLENSSESPVTGKRLYRTTTNGAVLFPWVEIDGNTITEVQDDLADVGLSLIAAPTLGAPPRLTLVSEWRNRLWGVGDIDRDNLRFSQADAMHSWPVTNGITIPGSGRDAFGIRALMPRREALGVGRRDCIWQITGDTPANFRAVKLSEILGVESNETVVNYRDTVWWLWKDGVYQWDANGLQNISDGKVKSWFCTDDYFNRGLFPFSFASFDPVRLKYRLFLASAESTSIDRWVEYDIRTGTWWGPHKTSAFTPTSAFYLIDDEDKIEAAIGSTSSFVWHDQAINADSTSTGIEFDILSKFYDGGQPDIEKVWGQISILGRPQDAGTITINGLTGYIDPETYPGGYDFTNLTYTMSNGRESLGRLGSGKLLQFGFNHTTAASNDGVELYGVEVPFTFIGRR